ncbi:MAG: AAA family ATPase [Methanomassiliicoccaceae archaeon]|nr:AAA family ATPase [Methanomassiliicoccaceae archaeon]
MKVKALRIRSFGKLTDRVFDDLPEGLIVITGSNESGKTTMMEFMRSTMFPSNKRKNYPEQTKNDSGSAELQTDSGEELVLLRNGKEVSEINKKDLPGKMFSMDSETYNAVFAMDLGDLENAEAISSGNIRNRFLTVPGGEAVPFVLKNIERSGTDIMNEDRITPKNPVYSLRKEIGEIGNEIYSLRRQSDEYDNTVEEMNALIKSTESAELDQLRTNEERNRRSILESQKVNVDAINKYSERRKETEYAYALTEEEMNAHARLCSYIGSLEERIERMDGTPPLTDDEISKIMGTERELTAILNGKASNDIPGSGAKDGASAVRRNTNAEKTMPLMLFIAAGISFAASIFITAAAAAGAALVAGAVLLLKRRSRDRIYNNRETNTAECIASGTEAVPISTGTITAAEETLRSLRKMIDNNAVRIANHKMRTEMIVEITSKKEELHAIEGEYGGKENFERTKADRKTLTEIDKTIGTLKKSAELSAGMEYESLVRELGTEPSVPQTDHGITDMKVRRGELKAKLDSLRSDDRLNLLLAEKDAKETELADKIKEWGVLSLQKQLIDRACGELYASMQPSVIKIANRYLGMMTRGRYTLDVDPRLEGINIRDASGYKTSKQWSSGLSDQVYLSIKMAVAKNMGSERLPMILDDVLVRFDTERKKAACGALLEFAKDQQVFLFSCVPLDGMFPDGTYRCIRL